MRRGKTRTLGMNFGTNPYDVAFLILAPALAVISFPLERRWQITLVALLAGSFGWMLLFASESWIDAQWIAMMEGNPNPSAALIEQFNTDGASKGAVLLFGFPVSLVYAFLCVLLVHGLRRLIGRIVHA
jgi:hypothetical protein